MARIESKRWMYFWGTTTKFLTIPSLLMLTEVARKKESMVANHGSRLPLDLQQMNPKLPYVVLLMLHLSMDEEALAMVERDVDDGVVEDVEAMDASLVVEAVEYVVTYDDEMELEAELGAEDEFDDENDVQSWLLELYLS